MTPPHPVHLTHLQRLESESIHILREVVAEAERPVMLYSMGKDSAVMLHLARKAFFPGRLPFPLLHVDTNWKFQAMYTQRQRLHDDAGSFHRCGIELDGRDAGFAFGGRFSAFGFGRGRLGRGGPRTCGHGKQ